MRHSLTLAISLAGALLLGAPLARAQELLLNGDFTRSDGQGGAASWGVYPKPPTGQPRAVTLVQPGYRTPQCACLAVAETPGNVGLFSHPAPVDKLAGEEVLFSCYYRTEGDPSAHLSLVGYAEPFLEKEWKTPYIQSESQILPATPGWSQACWRFRFLPGVREIVVIFRATQKGRLYVDDASLRPYPTEITCHVLSAGQVESLPDHRLVEVELTNEGAKERDLEVSALAVAAKLPAVHAGMTLHLAAGKTQTVRFNYDFDYRLSHALRLTVQSTDPPVVYDQHDFQVPGLISAELASPAFRHSLLDSIPTPQLAVTGALNVVPALRDKLQVSAEVVGIGGGAFTSVPSADPARYRLELPTPGLLSGDAVVRVTAGLPGNSDRQQVDLPLHRVAAGRPEVGYDQQRRLWVGGRRMLPLGLYGITDPDDLAAVSAAGFNFVIVPWTRASTDLRETAVKDHLGVVVSGTSDAEDFWVHLQEKWGTSPACLGWLPCSRPDLRAYAPAAVGTLYDQIAHLSPTEPVLEPLASPSLARYYAGAADILVAWSLPVPHSPLRALGEMVQALRDCAGDSKPVWAVIQAQGGGAFHDEPLGPAATGRAPTPAEMQALAYLALVRGADGLMFYSYSPPEEDTPNPLPRANPALWAALVTLNQNLRWLTPVLLDGTRTPLPPASGGAVELARWHYQDADYVIAVNTGANGVVTPLRLGVPHALGPVMFEDRAVQADADGDVQEVFAPYGVHVYVVGKAG